MPVLYVDGKMVVPGMTNWLLLSVEVCQKQAQMARTIQFVELAKEHKIEQQYPSPEGVAIKKTQEF